MESKKSTFVIVSGLLMCVACILFIVANALPAWGSMDFSEVTDPATIEKLIALRVTHPKSQSLEAVKVDIGLWKICMPVLGVSVCLDYDVLCSSEMPSHLLDSSCHKMRAARAFITLACILSALSAASLFALLSTNFAKDIRIILTSKILPCATFLMGIIGLAVGIAFTSDFGLWLITAKLTEAFILGTAAVAINMFGAILALMIRREPNY